MSRSIKNTGRKRGKRRLDKSGSKQAAAHPGHNWLYGRHAVTAALANPQRQIVRILATANTGKIFAPLAGAKGLDMEIMSGREIGAMLPAGAVHQGIAANVRPLAEVSLADLPNDRPLLVLDQVTDPHNVGAIMRSAAVFGASALVMTRRNSPPPCGVLAKSASGAMEYVHLVLVSNLSQALKELGKSGFWRIGLDAEASGPLEKSLAIKTAGQPPAIVLGAEDKGLRRLTREHCDELCHITTSGNLSSLNVSNAAAIALHVLATSNQTG